MLTSDEPVIVEQRYEASVERVWRALTDVEELRSWFFAEINEFEPRTGFETEFDVHAETRMFRHQWRLTEVIPNQKIVYGWKYEGLAGDASVEFELTPDGEGTLLRLTNYVLEDFQAGIPEFQRESCIGGWNYFIKEQLKEHLEG